MTSAIKNVKANVLRKEGIKINNEILPKNLIEFPLSVLSLVTVGVMKFALTKFGRSIYVIERVSGMKSIGLCRNYLRGCREQTRVTILTDLLDIFRETLALWF